MVNMTLAIPKEIHEKMKQHKEIKWTEVARDAIQKKITILETEKDPWKLYSHKKWAEEGVDAHDLFEF